MLEAIRNLINGVNDVSNVIELPTRLITILGIVTTALGYFTGRRRSLFEQSARGADEEMLAEMRQGFAAVSAAIAALSAGQDVPREQSAAAVAPQSAPATAPRVSRGTRRWARRPVLAICAAVALALTLVGVIGIFIASVDDAVFGVFSLLALLGLMMALVTLVWACVAALRQRRWGWAAALCFGTLALTFISVFTLPTLLILIFAVWGPTPSLAKPARPRTATASSGFVPPAAAAVPSLAAVAAALPSGLPAQAAAPAEPARPAHGPAANPAANVTADSARVVPIRSAPPSGRLMPPTFPAPTQPRFPVPDMTPGEDARGR